MQASTSVVGPDGSNNAKQFLALNDGAQASRITFAPIPGTVIGTQYTATVYVKGVNYNMVSFGFGNQGFPSGTRKQFYLDTVTTSDKGTAEAISIEDAGNGWRRLRITSKPATSTTSRYVYLDLGGPSADTHTTDQGFQVFGLQVEAGFYPTSYIPTSGSAVTRAADVSTSALGVDSFYNQSQGTVFSEYSVLGDKTNISQTIYRFSDGTVDNAITEFKRSNGNETVSQLKVNGSPTGRIEGNTNTPFNERYKTAFAFDGTDSQRAIKGNASSTAAVSSMPTINQLKLGISHNNTYPGTFYISRLAYFNTRLPAATLQNITS